MCAYCTGNMAYMMTSSNGNIFRVTGHLCGEFTGPGEFPAQRPVTRSFDVFIDLRLNKRLSKNGEAGDLRRHRGHYDVNVITSANLEMFGILETYVWHCVTDGYRRYMDWRQLLNKKRP